MNNGVKHGVLSKVYKEFIVPYLHFKPDTMGHLAFIEYLWDSENRWIERWKVKKPFSLRCKRKIFFDKAFKSKLRTQKDDELFVRYDKRNPLVIEIELIDRIHVVDSVTYVTDAISWRNLKHKCVLTHE